MPPSGRFFRPFLLWAVIALALCAIFPLSTAHASAVLLSLADSDVDLDGRLQHLNDPSGQLGIDAVLKLDPSHWDQNGKQSHGYTRDVHWYRVQLVRPEGVPADWILEMGRPYLDSVRLYALDGGDVRQYRFGDHEPVKSRPLATRLFAQPLSLPADRPMTLLIRVQSTSANALSVSLSRPDAFAVRQGRDGVIFGIFYGAMIIVFMFHMTIGSWISDRTHMIYGCFVIAQLLSYSFINGYGQLAAASDWPYLSDRVINLTNFIASGFGIWLWIEVLHLKRTYPLFYVLFRLLAIGFFSLTLIGWGELYLVVAPLAFFVISATLIVALILSTNLLRRTPDMPTVGFYMAAFAIAVLGLSLHMSALLGLLPLYWLPENLYQISACGHILFLSIGLVYRVRHLERERGAAREEAISASARADGQRSLVGMLSHEFRTPLAMIHSAAQMIRFRENTLAEGSRERLDRIEDTSRRLSALIDVFLASDALDQGKIVLSPRSGELSALVENVLNQFGGDARRIQMEAVPPIRLTADHDLLAVALRNCLANALNYSEPQTPVWLRFRDEGELLCISVEDEGPGIPADELDQLGIPYFRGRHGSAKTGSGLGISMVRTIVNAHGGSMMIDSSPGCGTRVILHLRDIRSPA